MTNFRQSNPNRIEYCTTIDEISVECKCKIFVWAASTEVMTSEGCESFHLNSWFYPVHLDIYSLIDSSADIQY